MQLGHPSTRSRMFRAIYLGNRWHGTETRSGPGSTTASTARLREALPRWCERYGVTSVLDAACGASWWMPELPGYIGMDIVPEAVAAVQERFPHRTYQVGDICAEQPEADLVIMRDVLAHLSNAEVTQALSSVKARYLAATTFADGDNASDTRAGGYHEIDLRQEPFGLGEPLEQVPDGYWEDVLVYPTKFMGLWALS